MTNKLEITRSNIKELRTNMIVNSQNNDEIKASTIIMIDNSYRYVVRFYIKDLGIRITEYDKNDFIELVGQERFDNPRHIEIV